LISTDVSSESEARQPGISQVPFDACYYCGRPIDHPIIFDGKTLCSECYDEEVEEPEEGSEEESDEPGTDLAFLFSSSPKPEVAHTKFDSISVGDISRTQVSLGKCSYCGRPIHSPKVFDGKTLCKECYDDACLHLMPYPASTPRNKSELLKMATSNTIVLCVVIWLPAAIGMSAALWFGANAFVGLALGLLLGGFFYVLLRPPGLEAYPPRNSAYNLHDVLNFCLQRLRDGHPILIGPCSDEVDKKLASIPPWMRTTRGLESILIRLPVALQKKVRSIYETPFFWGPHESIEVGEIEANHEILSALGYDFGAAIGALENVGYLWPEEDTKGATQAIWERIETINHIEEYPAEFRDPILNGLVSAKNYSLETRTAVLCIPVGVILSVVLLAAVGIANLLSMLVIGVCAGWALGRMIGSLLQNDAARRGIIYRRGRTWFIPI